MELTLKLTGTRPMLQHNGQMANPINPWVQKLKSMTPKTKKTDEDLIEIMRIESRGSCWETPEGYIGIPNAAVWRCLYDAATAYKLGAATKRGLSFEDTTVPVLFGERPMTCEDFLAVPGNIDYRPVVVNRNRTMRARPKLASGWVSVHRLDLLEDVIDPRAMEPVLARAGRLVGLGDWRPTYGTFTVEVL